MSAAVAVLLSAVWEAAGGWIIGALGLAATACLAWWRGYRGGQEAQAKKSQLADKRGEESARLAERQQGDAALTVTTIQNAQRGVHAQSDDSLRDLAADRWVRK